MRAARLGGAAGRLVRGKATRDEDVPNTRFDRAGGAGDSIGRCRATEHGCLGGIAVSEQYVLGLQEVDEMQVAVVGGKGAHLGGLSRIDGIRVPAGFCVTTDAFRRIMAEAPSIDDRLDQLSRLNPDDREAIRTLSAEIRRTLEEIAIPGDLAAAITRALAQLGEQAAYAVRSSATAEDLPTASFAGQQDTYLNVVGPAAILQHVSRCWASLSTEPADHHAVPHPRVRRPGEPRLRLRRSSADDDRPHEAPGAVLLADDDPRGHGRGRRPPVRRRHPKAGLAGQPRRPPGGPGEIRSADRGRAADHPRARRLHPAAA